MKEITISIFILRELLKLFYHCANTFALMKDKLRLCHHLLKKETKDKDTKIALMRWLLPHLELFHLLTQILLWKLGNKLLEMPHNLQQTKY
jgi:hypothetical protein